MAVSPTRLTCAVQRIRYSVYDLDFLPGIRLPPSTVISLVEGMSTRHSTSAGFDPRIILPL